MLRTLRSKLMIFFIFTAVVPMFAVGFISYTAQKQEITDSIERSLKMHNHGVSLEIQRFIRERLADTGYLAQNPVLMDPESSTLNIREQLASFLNVHNLYLNAIILDRDGSMAAGAEQSANVEDLSDRDWFKRASEGQKYMSDVYWSPVLDEPMMAMAAPVYDINQEIVGVVSPSFNLKKLYGLLQDYTLEQQDSGWGGYTFLLNGEGDVIVHPDYEKILNHNYFEEKNITKRVLNEAIDEGQLLEEADGEVHSFIEVDSQTGFEHEWYVGVAVDESELYAPLNGLLWRYLIIFPTAIVALTYAVYRLSDYLVKPVRRLVETAKQVAEGRKPAPIAVNAYEEVDYLSNTFFQMTKKLEERENSHKKASMVLDATNNGVFAFDRHNRKLTLLNRKCRELFFTDTGDLKDMTVDQLMAQSRDFKKLVENESIENFIERKETEAQFEVTCYIKGEERVLFLSASAMPKLETGDITDEILVVFNDLTEKRKMEQELSRSEKLKMAGEVAAGLAHEIRNPLTIIKGFIQLFDEEDEKKNRKYYQLINEEIDRVNKIMNELLNIANPKREEEKSEVDVASLLLDVLALYKPQMRADFIELETFVNDSLPVIHADSGKLKQVFINLIQNAIEAMPDGGRLNIRTGLNEGAEAGCGTDLVIQIQDSGEGMDMATVEKLGTPFFTTKQTGTGLGLTTSYRMVEEMKGTIQVISEKGKGALFTILLPITEPH